MGPDQVTYIRKGERLMDSEAGEIVVTEKLRARFLGKVRKQNNCWEWAGPLKEDGYPQSIYVAGRQRRVSHVALSLVGKARPSPEMMALHSCDNPTCVNPKHLRWGTELENRQDAIARWKGKGRSFSPSEVRAIRESSERPTDIARKFGVTCACITRIRSRVSHKHVA